MKVAVIGNGRVATHMSRALAAAGHEVFMCGGRNRQHPVPSDTEVLLISVKDDAIAQVASEFSDCGFLVLHTSGSVDMKTIPSPRRGVLYPMQTFSMDREVDFRKIPLFLETATPDDMKVLCSLATTLSDVLMPMDSEKRRTLHLAAVFCCNFVNHLLELAHGLLSEQEIPFSMMMPLIEETIAKINTITPHDAQTGPAVRWDTGVIRKHIDMLSENRHKEIYRLLSESIHAAHSDETDII